MVQGVLQGAVVQLVADGIASWVGLNFASGVAWGGRSKTHGYATPRQARIALDNRLSSTCCGLLATADAAIVGRVEHAVVSHVPDQSWQGTHLAQVHSIRPYEHTGRGGDHLVAAVHELSF